MIRIDELVVPASSLTCYGVAADVERWPEILPHYRWVRFQRRDDFGRGLVEMAAWREFGRLIRYPTWWVSEMESDETVPIVRYRHVRGITRGMEVRWEFLPDQEGTRIRIVHEWEGPAWPVIGTFAAERVIGPRFVSFIAQRTLLGVAKASSRREAARKGPREAPREAPREEGGEG